jgi:hypothetical protein
MYPMSVTFSPPRRRSVWLSCWTIRPATKGTPLKGEYAVDPAFALTRGRAVGGLRILKSSTSSLFRGQ